MLLAELKLLNQKDLEKLGEEVEAERQHERHDEHGAQVGHVPSFANVA